MPIYAAPSYAMGLDVPADATTPVTPAQAQRARVELQQMRRGLERWLRYRRINDRVASGQPVPDALLRRPGAVAPPAPVLRTKLQRERLADEQPLAEHLYQLLGEVFDARQLPAPDLRRDPEAAVKLAQIAISGRLPGEATQPQDVGFVWLWPAVIVVGAIALVLTTLIRSRAQSAEEREHYECIKSGKCTDSGFWLKIGGVVAVGWFVWDKLGARERLTGALKPKKALP